MTTPREALWSGQKMLRAFLSLVVLIGVTISADRARAESPNDILVIANLGVKTNSIDMDELRDMFLKKRINWGPGEKAVPLNVSADPKLRDEFRAVVLKMSETEEQRYWQTRRVKEGDSEPPTFGNVLKAVFKLRGAVSYIYRSQYKEGVAKVVLVIPAGK